MFSMQICSVVPLGFPFLSKLVKVTPVKILVQKRYVFCVTLTLLREKYLFQKMLAKHFYLVNNSSSSTLDLQLTPTSI